MWFLYKLDKDNNYIGALFRRLRPSHGYHLKDGNTDFKIDLRIGSMKDDDVKDPNFRPTVQLVKTGQIQVKVDDEEKESGIYLLDQHRISTNNSSTQFRLQWQNFNIYHYPRLDQEKEDNKMLAEMAKKYGFHLVRRFHPNSTTHFFFSNVDKDQIDCDVVMLLALCHKIPFIDKNWIKGLSVKDKEFNLTAYTGAAKPIEVDNWGMLHRTAIFGPHNDRKTLFMDMEFVFFEKIQYTTNKEVIRLCGGQSKLCTLEEGMTLPIEPRTLYVSPYNPTEEFTPVKNIYCEKNEVPRCIAEFEIYSSIVYTSTNLCCNPSADLSQYISPTNSHASTTQQTHSNTITAQQSNYVKIKQEPIDDNQILYRMDDHKTPRSVLDDQLSRSIDEEEHSSMPSVAALGYNPPSYRPTYNEDQDTEDYNSTSYNDPTSYHPMNDEDHDTVPYDPNMNSIPIVKREVIEQSIEQFSNDYDEGDEDVKDPSLVLPAHEEHTGNDQHDPSLEAGHEDQPMDEASPESPSLQLPDDFMGNFLDNMFSSQKSHLEKRRAEKSQQEERQRQEHLERERKEMEEQERRQRETEREEKERQEKEKREEARLARLREQKEIEERRAIEQQQEEEELLPSLPAEPDHHVDDDNTDMDVDETQAENNTYTRQRPGEEDQDKPYKYIKVVYAPLVVNENPPVMPAASGRRRTGGINYKRFVKTKQLQHVDRTEIVPLMACTQRPGQQAANHTREIRVENMREFDPDIMITAGRRRTRR